MSDQLVRARVNRIRVMQFDPALIAKYYTWQKNKNDHHRKTSQLSRFILFHLSAIHSSAALRSISRKYDLHVCIARTLFLLRRFSFIRLVYYEKLVWEFLSALLRQEEKTRKSRLHANARNACRDFVKL